MTKITMQQVYKKVDNEIYEQLEDARKIGDEVIRFDFKDFSRAVRIGDFITTNATIKAKWESAKADGVIQPLGQEQYGRALLIIEAFDHKLGLSKAKRVCVCVCNTKDEKSNTVGVKA